MINSLIITILVVGTAQSQNVYSSHNHLPLRIRFNDLNIVENLLNGPYDNKYYLRDVYKSESDFGFEVLRSLGNNIIDLDNRLSYYKKVITILEEEKSLGIYEIIELIKEIRVIMFESNVYYDLDNRRYYKMQALKLLSNLTEKLENLVVNHLVDLFDKFKAYNGEMPTTNVILECIYEFDRDLCQHIYFKFVNVTYRNNETDQDNLLLFINANSNLDLRAVGLLKLIDLLSPISTSNMLYKIVNSVEKITESDGFNNLPFSTKYKLKQKLLSKIPSCVPRVEQYVSGSCCIKFQQEQFMYRIHTFHY